jgi:SET domain-containing protein
MNCKGIAKPNVVMKIAYVEELPRVMIVCMRDINAGEELLLQYLEEDVEEYIP